MGLTDKLTQGILPKELLDKLDKLDAFDTMAKDITAMRELLIETNRLLAAQLVQDQFSVGVNGV